jgi:hypothetical protein
MRERRPNEGWIGQVVDAHDGQAVRNARVRVIVRTFPGPSDPGAHVLADLLADAAGGFSLPAAQFPREAQLHVEAPWHIVVEQPLPPPHELIVAMISRRRGLLDRMVTFATREWGISQVGREPTPDQVARRARRGYDAPTAGARARQIEVWAAATEHAAYGPGDVDESTEAAILSLEPR